MPWDDLSIAMRHANGLLAKMDSQSMVLFSEHQTCLVMRCHMLPLNQISMLVGPILEARADLKGEQHHT